MSARAARTNISDTIIGEHPTIARLRTVIERIATTTLPVLIQGPTGSGKELVARALHALSGRRGPLVAFNVCAISDTMFEDAVFGHVRGAFTGAVTDAPGYLLEADLGTAFLDEIGGLALHSQVKLLRAIERGEFRPVGGRHDRHSDFRLVTATNEPLATLVDAGRFRRDLAHRLGGLVIDVPSLSARRSDIPLLVAHLLRRAQVDNAAWELTEGAASMLMEHDWPGNVRELTFVVERLLFCAHGTRITRAAVRDALGAPAEIPGEMDSFERRRLTALLVEHRWDTVQVARRLGVNRATVYRRMKKASIVVPIDAYAEADPPLPVDRTLRGNGDRRDARSESPTRL